FIKSALGSEEFHRAVGGRPMLPDGLSQSELSLVEAARLARSKARQQRRPLAPNERHLSLTAVEIVARRGTLNHLARPRQRQPPKVTPAQLKAAAEKAVKRAGLAGQEQAAEMSRTGTSAKSPTPRSSAAAEMVKRLGLAGATK